MRKPKTLKERAGAYSRRLCGEAAGELNDARRACALSGYIAGHRANRISAAQRRVVEAAIALARPGKKTTGVSIPNLLAAVENLERAKGGRNG